MLIWMIREGRGFLKIRASGGFNERFLNLASAAGVELWDIKAQNGVLFACTNVKTYPKLRRVAKQSGMRLCVAGRHGSPFLFQRLRERLGVVVGLVIFFAVVYTLSLFVWNVQITGNQAMTEEQVRTALTSLGLDSGVLKSSLNLPVLKREAMLNMPELSWITFQLKGSSVFVELRESKQAPDIVPQDTPCNIVASRDGQILRVQVEAGQSLVQPGDIVVEGDPLVSGISEDAFGETVLHHASGEIIAATTRVLTEKVPLHQTVLVPSGNMIQRQRFQLFGVEIPLSVSPAPQGENYRREVWETPVTLFGAQLPAVLYTEKWEELTAEDVTYTQEEAAQIAEESLEKTISEQLEGVTITKREKRLIVENDTLIYQLTLYCEENIGKEAEILIN